MNSEKYRDTHNKFKMLPMASQKKTKKLSVHARGTIYLNTFNPHKQHSSFFLNALPSFAIWQSLVCDG